MLKNLLQNISIQFYPKVKLNINHLFDIIYTKFKLSKFGNLQYPYKTGFQKYFWE